MLKIGAPKLVVTLSLVLFPCNRKRTNCELPPASSLTKRCSSSPHSIHAGEVGLPEVRFCAGPPPAGTIHTSPPVDPWSLIRPPINAIVFLSGDHRGTAICIPCSGPFASTGSRMDFAGPPSSWVYNLATHQLFSPGGSAAI